MELIAIWALFILVGAALGSSRRGALDGAIWGLLLGPIGWVITVCFGRRPQCADCGSYLVKGFKKCSKCGGVAQSK